ncbi:hypothetical protein BDW42DRAFT_169527, partial [Aspergillus taichungensis]
MIFYCGQTEASDIINRHNYDWFIMKVASMYVLYFDFLALTLRQLMMKGYDQL